MGTFIVDDLTEKFRERQSMTFVPTQLHGLVTMGYGPLSIIQRYDGPCAAALLRYLLYRKR